MSNEIKETKDSMQPDKKPDRRKVSEETLQMIANLIITTVSSAALVISIATGMKAKKRK